MDGAELAALVRRAFGTSVPVRCESRLEASPRRCTGPVRGPETYYLRIAEEADDNLETDAESAAHQSVQGLQLTAPRSMP